MSSVVVRFIGMNKSIITSFILGFTSSVILVLAFWAGQQQAATETSELQNRQFLMDSKVHLIEMKVDVVTDQKDIPELQSDYQRIMSVLEQSHEYTGEGIIARDKAMREAAGMINDAIVEGGSDLVDAIDKLLDAIEEHLHASDEVEILE